MNRKRVIGIDAGAFALKVVQFRIPKRGRAVLERSGCFPWASGDKNRHRTAKELKAHLGACSISRGAACSALSDPGLLIRRMALPSMPPRDMQEVLRFKVRKEMEAQPDDIVVDYLALGAREPAPRELCDLLVFAVTRRALDVHLRFLEGAGVRPVCVEPPLTGLSHLLESCPALDGKGGVLLLDLGSSRTGLVLLEDRRPVFVREIPFSGALLTRNIQEALAVDARTAEQWKCGVGLREPEGDGDPRARSVPDVLLPLVEDFLAEIQYTLGYVQDQLVRAPSVTTLLLAGGGADMPGLAGMLEQTFGLPCRPLPDVQAMGVPVSDDFKSYGHPVTPSGLGTALGLALREARG